MSYSAGALSDERVTFALNFQKKPTGSRLAKAL